MQVALGTRLWLLTMILLCNWLKELDNGYCQGLVMQVT